MIPYMFASYPFRFVKILSSIILIRSCCCFWIYMLNSPPRLNPSTMIIYAEMLSYPILETVPSELLADQTTQTPSFQQPSVHEVSDQRFVEGRCGSDVLVG